MTTKEERFAHEFSEKNKRLMADVRQVKRSIEMLSERKMNDVLILNTQLTMSHISGNIVVPYIDNLRKTLRLEERYLKMILRKLREFVHEVRVVENDSKRITGRRFKQFIELSGRYIVDLRLVLKNIVKLIILVLRINYYQQRFINKVEKSLAKHKVPRSLTKQFYKKNYDEYNDMKELLEQLEKIRIDMDKVRNRLIDSFQASRGPLSKIGGL